MGSVERSKKKVQLWKKAVAHFLLCFFMGFFSGFAPTSKSPFRSHYHIAPNISEVSPQPVAQTSVEIQTRPKDMNRVMALEVQREEQVEELVPRRLIIVVTPINARDQLRGVLLRKLANTLTLVPPPLLWVVVETRSDSSEASKTLRKTNVMYRHLVVKENFTDAEIELEHQRNVALNHIEHHRLSGIVHFASLSNVYDLRFFDEIRAIAVFGTWPMAFLSPNRKKVMIEGPVCDSSDVIGWHLKMNNSTDTTRSPSVHISSFGFNSSILWDPERWGRLSSNQHTSQNSIKFVKEEVVEEETKLKGIPPDGCSKVMLWNVQNPVGITANSQLSLIDASFS